MKQRSLLVYLMIAIGLVVLPAAAEPGPQGRPAEQVQQTAAEPGWANIPAKLVLPIGTIITVRTTQMLSSDRNQPGDSFTAVLEQPLVAQGWVAAQRGQTVMGRVAVAKKAPRGFGASQLAIEFNELTLVDGQQIPIRTQLIQSSLARSSGQGAAVIGASTGIGAVIGGAAGGGEGAAIGAAAGAVASIIGVLSTRGGPTVIPPESVMTLSLESGAIIDTLRSQQAFLPVTAQDYSSSSPQGTAMPKSDTYRPRVYQTPPRYYYPPNGYCYGCYPGPYIGYYGGFGFGYGPGIYAAPRAFIGPRYHGWRR